MLEFFTDNAHLSGILLAYSILAVGALSPGPAVLAIIGTSMEKGRQPGLWLTVGVISGSAVWGSAAALGISAVLISYSNVLIFIKIAGGIYLLWLAWKSLKSAIEPQDKTINLKSKSGTVWQLWRAGFLLHLTNPKAVIGWTAMIALGVTPSSPLWVSFVLVIGGVFISFLCHALYACVFSTRRMSAIYLRAKRPINLLFSGFFGFAGFKLITSRI
jgi:threonine/homoserine/homoserine lactone efflux protein